MVARMLRVLVVLHSISVLIPTSCYRKKEPKMKSLPIYHVYTNDTIPSDVQITTYLVKGVSKRYFYQSQMDDGALSLTLITCTSPVEWSFKSTNTTHDNNTITTTIMDTYHLDIVMKDVYILELIASERNTYAHIYVSTEAGGPQALQNTKFTNLRLLKRQKKKRLTVKWNPSLVDPQVTDYCLVVSSTHPHRSLCFAQPDPSLIQKDPIIACVGRKTHFTLSNLKQGQNYYFDLFAINHQSNFTYPYGATTTIFDTYFKPTTLKDGKGTFANLKNLDGKAVFRYKIGKQTTKSLNLFIMPCGGAVDVEVKLKDTTVIPPKRIEGYGKITIPNPVKLARYHIKIFALNREELKKTTGVEIYATTKSPMKVPLPNMPEVVKVEEYASLKTCDSVTVGWVAAPVQNVAHYCLVAKEGKIREMDEFRMSNQCGLDNRLKKSADFAVKYCIDVKHDKEQVVVRKINQLKPGRNYIIQVTVKKPKGRTLSYDLLQVYTKATCQNPEDAV